MTSRHMTSRIGLALSGGGVRAMIFHAGMLKWLATDGWLESISAISTVSGGSLITGLVYRFNDWKWPSSEQYQNKVFPEIRRLLTTVCLQSEARKLILTRPSNWRHFFSRANVLASAISQCWGVNVNVGALQSNCEWSINATTAETGRRFRFKQGRCGDYETGYAPAGHFALSEAMAASAAYPLLIGPLRINASKLQWSKRATWGGTTEEEQSISAPFEWLHLMDGGIYDNLGMEPLFDVGKQTPKPGVDFIIVSDAGAALTRQPLHAQWSWKRLSRILEISMDQARALRIRPFINAILENPFLGRYYQIGSVAEDALKKFLEDELRTKNNHSWLSRAECLRASHWATDLKKVSVDEFDLISRHGFETAKWNEMLFSRKKINHDS
ncbi:patatin-like phospholipase family protein [Paraburkholderia azotifigens]|uniref:patatin-like phospholipase family protein n=1 Tax=Paraburkholderia azotifigens TaxID=2057004 RepID=UPI0031718B35